MARKPLNPPPVEHPVLNEDAAAQALTAMDTVNQNVIVLAEQLGYDGSLTVGSLEDEIRFYQRRSVEAVMALGTRLLLLKEMTPHGEFKQRIELLGISERMGQKFMASTLKFSKANSSSLLQAAGNQTKLLELLVLDDGEIEALSQGDSVRGITLDEIEVMSVSELKTALRDARENEQAMGRVLQEKNAKLDKLSADSGKKPAVTDLWDTQLLGVSDEIHSLGLLGDEAIGKHLAFIDLCEMLADKLDPEEKGHLDKREQVRVPISRVNEQLKRWAHLVARLQFEFENRLSMYLDNTHILPMADTE